MTEFLPSAPGRASSTWQGQPCTAGPEETRPGRMRDRTPPCWGPHAPPPRGPLHKSLWPRLEHSPLHAHLSTWGPTWHGTWALLTEKQSTPRTPLSMGAPSTRPVLLLKPRWVLEFLLSCPRGPSHPFQTVSFPVCPAAWLTSASKAGLSVFTPWTSPCSQQPEREIPTASPKSEAIGNFQASHREDSPIRNCPASRLPASGLLALVTLEPAEHLPVQRSVICLANITHQNSC